ncbi:MAG: hypothetical protein H0T51_05545 [Pirellulales bacterium]|nr:hypothetical protein [Pirellulales bacterium]
MQKSNLGQSIETLLSGVDNVIDLDAAYIESLLGTATHLGLLLKSTTSGPYVAIVASEATSGTPPTLMIEYALPAANGDFDGDEDVDGNDFLVWQRGQSPRPGKTAHLAEWRTNFGRVDGTVRSASVPEPMSGALMAWATMAPLIWRRSARTAP